MGVLEVGEPAPQHRVEFGDQSPQALTTGPARRGPHLVLERFQALLAHPATTRFDAVAQNLDSLPWLPAVPDMRLLRMLGQATGPGPFPDLRQRSPRRRFAGTQDHAAVGAAHRPIALGPHP